MASSNQDEHSNSAQSHTRGNTNTSISGFSRVYAEQRDDNLPEVYVDDTPQAISKEDPNAAAAFYEAQSPKFSIAYEVSPQTAIPPEYSVSAGATSAAATTVPPTDASPSKDQKVFGIGRRTFFIILAVLLIVFAAAVGGGVGGAVAASSASKSGSSDDGGNAEDGGDTSPTSTSEVPSSTTAAAAETGTATATETASEVPSATPQFLNNGTVLLESFAFQGFSEQEYLGNVTEMYTEERGFNFDFGIASYVWAPQGTGCCVSYCMNATSQGMVGWGCSARKQPKSSDEFRRIFIWCGEKHSQENAICSD